MNRLVGRNCIINGIEYHLRDWVRVHHEMNDLAVIAQVIEFFGVDCIQCHFLVRRATRIRDSVQNPDVWSF